jgi:hypothetical protein
MPIRPTKGTTAVYLDLPSDLVERVRDFAKRDQRTVKMEYVRALELLLATHDTGAAPTAPPVAATPSTPPAEDLDATEKKRRSKARKRT